jgi:hypothetical protein
LDTMFGHHILSTYRRHLFTKVCILRWISFVTSQVSHLYKSTDFNFHVLRALSNEPQPILM